MITISIMTICYNDNNKNNKNKVEDDADENYLNKRQTE